MIIPRQVITKLLDEQCTTKYGVLNGWEIWIKDDVIIIQLPVNQDIEYDMLEVIALEQLEMNILDFDYWVGENVSLPQIAPKDESTEEEEK